MQSSAKVPQKGGAISKAGYPATGWYPITLPASVIAGLLQNGVYEDPYYGKNFERIEAGDFNPSWWYRTEFVIPASERGKHVWLKLEGLSYRASVWINGVRLTDSTETVGQFRAFEFDIAQYVEIGKPIALAIEVERAKQPLKHGDLAITYVDWNPNPPDWNMGILNDVVVSTSGPVIVRHPLVTTRFALPSLNTAYLTIEAEVTNASSKPVEGTLRGSIATRTFAQTVELAPGEVRRVVFPEIALNSPRIWWPFEYGTPELETLDLAFESDKAVSDALTTSFGIRQVTSELRPVDENDPKGPQTRVFSVNGKPIQIRGGAWAPDIFQRRSTDREEAEMRYMRDLHLNALRLEGKMEDEAFFDLTDKYGILVMVGWNCCDTWSSPGDWNAEQRTVAYESLRTQMYNKRNHPSMLVWANGSDMPPSVGAYAPFHGSPEVESEYLAIESDLHWPNPILSSASDYPSLVDPDPTGVKMLGPYDWVPPIYWETDTDRIAGGAWGFATEISPGAAPPPFDSLVKFIPPDHLWPIDDYWNYHAGGPPFDLTLFNEALDARYGPSFSTREYAKKAQVAAYESHRAMFEAYGRHKYQASGLIQWMMRNGWPSMIWHLYDWYLRPGGAYYGVKHAMEPLHLQYSYADKSIVLVNSSLQTYSGLSATASVYNLEGVSQHSDTYPDFSVGADSAKTLFTLGFDPPKVTKPTTYFLRLSLVDKRNNPLSTQTYWLSTTPDVVAWDTTDWWGTLQSAFADYTALDSLPSPTLQFSDEVLDSTCAPGSDTPANAHRVTVSNKGNMGKGVAFFVHLKITKGEDGEEVLPVFWEDNYFTLLPGETRTVVACYAKEDLGDKTPVVHLDTYND